MLFRSVIYLWTHVYVYSMFDIGGVHNLLVGSESTQCGCHIYLCFRRFKNIFLYPTIGGVIPYVIMIIISLLLYVLPGDVPCLVIVGFGILGIVSARPINE